MKLRALLLAVFFSALCVVNGCGISQTAASASEAGSHPKSTQSGVSAKPRFLNPLHLTEEEEKTGYYVKTSQSFGAWYAAYQGYHPAVDLTVHDGSGNRSLGRNVYAAGPGRVVMVTSLGNLGYLVVIEHNGSFDIPAKAIGSAGYDEEKGVKKIYSAYMHITGVPENILNFKRNGAVVDENTVLGTIADLKPAGLAPHLHFEIRNAEPTGTENKDPAPSTTWTLLGNSNNWQQSAGSNGKTYYNGYYKNLQGMLDTGLRDPEDFLNANSGTAAGNSEPASASLQADLNGEPSVQSTDLTFGQAVDYNTNGTNFNDLVIKDFNSDGILDIACVGYGGSDQPGESNKLLVYLGKGDGTFLLSGGCMLGTTPIFMTSGDFNNDGAPDIAVSNIISNDISVVLGKGDGTFGIPAQFSVGRNPAGIISADFNHDGYADIAVCNQGDNCIALLFGTGKGTFILSPYTYYAGEHPQSMAAGDLNNDGCADLVVSDIYSGCVSVLMGMQSSEFQDAVRYNAGAHPCNIAIGDFNQDNIPDLAVTNEDSNDVSVLPGNGDGTFKNAVNYPGGSGAHALTLNDFNNDRINDIAVTDLRGSTISTLLGNGDGTFEPVSNNMSISTFGSAVGSGDFNGDGRIDIAVAAHGGIKVYIRQ